MDAANIYIVISDDWENLCCLFLVHEDPTDEDLGGGLVSKKLVNEKGK